MHGGPLYDASPQWHLVFLTTHLAWAVAEFGFFRLARQPGASPQRRSAFVYLVAASLVTCAVLSNVYPQGRIVGPPERVLIPSLVLTWLGIAIRALSLHQDVGAAAGLGRAGKRGLYRWLRYPAYTGAYVTLGGIALGFGNALSVAVVLLASTIFFAWLLNGQADQTEAGAGRSGRWQILPFLW